MAQADLINVLSAKAKTFIGHHKIGVGLGGHGVAGEGELVLAEANVRGDFNEGMYAN